MADNNNDTKTYSLDYNVTFISQLLQYHTIWDSIENHWKYCGGTVEKGIWQATDNTLTEFYLTFPDPTIKVYFTEIFL